MARTDNLTNFLTDVAEAIKTKKGDSTSIKASDFDTEIENLPSGGGSGDVDWSAIGYNSTPQSIIDPYDYAVEIKNNWVSSTFYNSKFKTNLDLIYMPLVDTSNGTNFSEMFSGCTNLTTVPELNTSSGTNFSEMFSGCTNLTTVPELNTSSGTNFYNMFYNCTNLTIIPEIDTSNGTNFTGMFRSCSKLTTIPELNTGNGTNFNAMFNSCTNLTTVPELNTPNGLRFNAMFQNCSKLTTIPELNTGNGTNFYGMFQNCSNLTTIPELNASSVTDINNMFSSCTNLLNLGGLLNLGKAFVSKKANYSSYTLNLSSSTKLTYDSLMNIINKLYDLNITYDVANGGTLYTQKLVLGTTNMAKLTADEIAIATNKGWTVS